MKVKKVFAGTPVKCIVFIFFCQIILCIISFIVMKETVCYSSSSYNSNKLKKNTTTLYNNIECPSFIGDKSHPDFICKEEILKYRNRTSEKLSPYEGKWHSQFWEDYFIYTEFFHHDRYKSNNHDRDYTFIELGAYNGLDGSNSYFYEYILNWKGILIEASTLNYVNLELNRNRTSNVVTIHAGICNTDKPKLLTIWGGESLTANNRPEKLFHSDYRSNAICLKMNDIIEGVLHNNIDNKTIKHIDYFSMDVEGQELEIILTHDWIKYPVFVVSIETAIQPLLGGTAEYQHEKRCALFKRGLCRWPFYDEFIPPTGPYNDKPHFSINNEIWINPKLMSTI